ncbi:MAG TPA: HEAT repeat domain-containing protein, partial [Chlamydiales bacterium]|nr:HEAT repeat domain-containing protein [Chlamydiales bacterium]
MLKLPPFFRVYFPEFYALIGTPKAVSLLRGLMNDPELNVRSAAMLSAADFGRDDLLGYMRAAATHKNPAEQEVSAIALGRLGDTHSKDTLKKMLKSPYDNVKLAAMRSLAMLGETNICESITELAKSGDLFAILALGAFPEAADTLKQFLQSDNRDQKLNAALALLQLKDPDCTLSIAELLTARPLECACQPIFSTGKAQSAWRFAPASERYAKLTQTDIIAITLNLKERILQSTIELPEQNFLQIADIILNCRVIPLIPSLVHLLENKKNEGAIQLLKKHTNAIGSPLIRGYCNLVLFRLGEEGPYEQQVVLETLRLKDTELIR